MLTRTAQLLQANIQQQSRGFDVTKAFTVVTATAEVSVRTTFFQVPVATVHADNERRPTSWISAGSAPDIRSSSIPVY